jgi:hypothetical protein
MTLNADQRKKLDLMRVSAVRLKLQYAGPGEGSVVPGLLDGMVLRGDVEGWLAEQDDRADQLQANTLWWAKAATVVGVIFGLLGIVVAIAIAVVQLRVPSH